MRLGRKFGVRCRLAKRCKFSNAQHGVAVASLTTKRQSVATLQIQHGDNGAMLAGEAGKAKMGQWLGGGLLSLSLSLLALFSTLKFLNALFVRFLRLSLRAVCLKTADFVILSVATQRVARRKPQQKNPKD